MGPEKKFENGDVVSSVRVNRRRLLAGSVGLASGAALVSRDVAALASNGAGGRQTVSVTQAQDAEGQETLTIGIAADFVSLDPHLSVWNNDNQYSFNVFDNVVARRPDGQLYPMLATEWEAIDDTTWEFKLRDDVTFHNGDPLTSADIKFSIERTYDPDAQTVVASVFASVESIETPDDYTVRFITKEIDPLLDARLASYGGQILPKNYFEEVGADEFGRHPIGSGPVKFVEWARDQYLELEAVDDYWGGRIDVDRVMFRPIPEASSRLASLQAGESDLVVNLTPDLAEQLNDDDSVYVASAPYHGMTNLLINAAVPPLDDMRIRQALSLAIDREAIVQELWRGYATNVNGPIPNTDAIGYDPDLPPLLYDPDEARRLLQEANYDGEPIYLETTDGVVTNDKPMADAIVAMWMDVGINAVEEVITQAVRAELLNGLNWKGMLWIELKSTVGEMDGMIWRTLRPGGSDRIWSDPEFDRLGAEANSTLDPVRREELYHQMVEIFNEHLPELPILQADLLYGVQNAIEWQPNGSFQLDVRAHNLQLKTP